jgi:hypothetical protein
MMKQRLLKLIMSVLRLLPPSTSSFNRLPSNHPLLEKPVCIFIKILMSMVIHRLFARPNVLGTKYFSFIYMGRLHVSAFLPCTQPDACHRLPPVRIIRLCSLISFCTASTFSCTSLLIIPVHSLMRSIGFTTGNLTPSNSSSIYAFPDKTWPTL